jgi:hypothetical protein
MSANPYIVNIVELQNVVNNIQGVSPLQQLQTDVANLQQMVIFDTKTIAVDILSNFTADRPIEVVANLNLSNTSLYTNNTIVSFNTNGTTSLTTDSYISSFSTITVSTLRTGPMLFETYASTFTMNHLGYTNLLFSTTGTLRYISSPQYQSTGVDIAGYLYVSQDAYVKTLYQRSDQTLKYNIQPFNTTVETVLQLKPKRFDWIETGESDLGFIAQEVQTVWPELITQEPNGTLGIAYSKMVPLLLESIRELTHRVAVLEAAAEKTA